MPASKRKFIETEKNLDDKKDDTTDSIYPFSMFERKQKKIIENGENDPNVDNHSTRTASPSPCQTPFHSNLKSNETANEFNENNLESDSTTSSQTSTSMGASIKRLRTENATTMKKITNDDNNNIDNNNNNNNNNTRNTDKVTSDSDVGTEENGNAIQLRTSVVNSGIFEKQEEHSKEHEAKLNKMKEAVTTLLECIGEDPTRNGLVDTPLRVSKALLYMTKGYEKTLKEVVGNGIFDEDHNEMVIVRDIDIYSLCEHHMVPFIGKVHIGYIPKSKVLGLSKLARIAEMFSRRLQVQERLTKQIAEAIEEAISPLGVAVVMESSHMCMVMRGVEKPGSSTITSSVTGCFKSSATRNEFFSLIGHQRIMR